MNQKMKFLKFFFIFDDNYKLNGDDVDYINLVIECNDIYNKINNEFICYEIVRIDEDKNIDYKNIPTGSPLQLLAYFIKVNFGEYKEDIEKGKNPVILANEIIEKDKAKKNKRI